MSAPTEGVESTVIETTPAEGRYGVDDDNEDDRFAFGLHDVGSYAAEELAVHLI